MQIQPQLSTFLSTRKASTSAQQPLQASPNQTPVHFEGAKQKTLLTTALAGLMLLLGGCTKPAAESISIDFKVTDAKALSRTPQGDEVKATVREWASKQPASELNSKEAQADLAAQLNAKGLSVKNVTVAPPATTQK